MLSEKKSMASAMEHKSTVIKAACVYVSTDINLNGLSFIFNVSQNTISNWFCEAISEKYIANDAICINIMKKHVAEYEELHRLENSHLRTMYAAAFAARSTISPKIISSITNVTV